MQSCIINTSPYLGNKDEKEIIGKMLTFAKCQPRKTKYKDMVCWGMCAL